jgi:hypothetical protein
MELILLGVDVPEWLAMAFCLLVGAAWVWALFTIPPSGARAWKEYERRRVESGLPRYAEYGRSDVGDAGGWGWGDAGGGDGGDGGGGE